MSRTKTFCHLRSQKGFSLVELMIVVGIIGLLAALAVPKFQMFQAKAKQSEAKNNLSHIYTLQISYQADNDAFAKFDKIGRTAPGKGPAACNHTTTANVIGFKPVGDCSKIRYGYEGVTANNVAFSATATSYANLIVSGCSELDTWTINNNKKLVASKDAVSLCK